MPSFSQYLRTRAGRGRRPMRFPTSKLLLRTPLSPIVEYSFENEDEDDDDDDIGVGHHELGFTSGGPAKWEETANEIWSMLSQVDSPVHTRHSFAPISIPFPTIPEANEDDEPEAEEDTSDGPPSSPEDSIPSPQSPSAPLPLTLATPVPPSRTIPFAIAIPFPTIDDEPEPEPISEFDLESEGIIDLTGEHDDEDDATPTLVSTSLSISTIPLPIPFVKLSVPEPVKEDPQPCLAVGVRKRRRTPTLAVVDFAAESDGEDVLLEARAAVAAVSCKVLEPATPTADAVAEVEADDPWDDLLIGEATPKDVKVSEMDAWPPLSPISDDSFPPPSPPTISIPLPHRKSKRKVALDHDEGADSNEPTAAAATNQLDLNELVESESSTSPPHDSSPLLLLLPPLEHLDSANREDSITPDVEQHPFVNGAQEDDTKVLSPIDGINLDPSNIELPSSPVLYPIDAELETTPVEQAGDAWWMEDPESPEVASKVQPSAPIAIATSPVLEYSSLEGDSLDENPPVVEDEHIGAPSSSEAHLTEPASPVSATMVELDEPDSMSTLVASVDELPELSYEALNMACDSPASVFYELDGDLFPEHDMVTEPIIDVPVPPSYQCNLLDEELPPELPELDALDDESYLDPHDDFSRPWGRIFSPSPQSVSISPFQSHSHRTPPTSPPPLAHPSGLRSPISRSYLVRSPSPLSLSPSPPSPLSPSASLLSVSPPSPLSPMSPVFQAPPVAIAMANARSSRLARRASSPPPIHSTSRNVSPSPPPSHRSKSPPPSQLQAQRAKSLSPTPYSLRATRTLPPSSSSISQTLSQSDSQPRSRSLLPWSREPQPTPSRPRTRVISTSATMPWTTMPRPVFDSFLGAEKAYRRLRNLVESDSPSLFDEEMDADQDPDVDADMDAETDVEPEVKQDEPSEEIPLRRTVRFMEKEGEEDYDSDATVRPDTFRSSSKPRIMALEMALLSTPLDRGRTRERVRPRKKSGLRWQID
ncbi:hypothetical protein DL93DRAFT_2099466 [Clavulina sp. PMI_390]|nr:hypothetical protein DL93DRAFT_2099466 [Clavulina sp. PMI_390]